jgi:anti-sigma B factor antagonist
VPDVRPSTSIHDDHVVVTLRGDLDVTGAAAAEAAITAVATRLQWLIVDMSALDFMDCSSLSALLRVQRLAREADGDLVLAAPQRLVLQLLALTRKDDAFCVHASVDAAVAGLASRRTRYGGRGSAVSAACPGRAAPVRTGTG